MKIRLGTRQSQLAKWQAEWVAAELAKLGAEVEMVPITTQGDVASQPLGQIGGQGLFTKEIQRALLDHRCDVAVHSLKDLPTDPVPGLTLGAVPEREQVFDVLIGRTAKTLETLPPHAIVGTGSIRRAAQLRAIRPDLVIRDIRGNLDTRLKKLDDGHFDAILLAAAGLYRLDWAHRITQTLPIDWMLPAVGQAALGIEVRQDDRDACLLIQNLNHSDSYNAVTAERSMLRALRGGCLAPVAALASIQNNQLTLAAKVLATDGTRYVSTQVAGNPQSATQIGEQAAALLQLAGAENLIAHSRSENL